MSVTSIGWSTDPNDRDPAYVYSRLMLAPGIELEQFTFLKPHQGAMHPVFLWLRPSETWLVAAEDVTS